MSVSEGVRLSEVIREKLGQLNRLCAGLDEPTALRAPSGRWSPKEILSHLAGVEGKGLLPSIQLILEQEMPTLDLEPANPFFTDRRREMTFAGLLDEVKKEYEGMAELTAALSDEQLSRTVHIPMFKETPLGEYLTLGAFVGALAEHHLDYHIAHMKEILQELKEEG